jgi:hypothetical protein
LGPWWRLPWWLGRHKREGEKLVMEGGEVEEERRGGEVKKRSCQHSQPYFHEDYD